MNFQAIRQIKGQQDGNFPAKLEMFGTFTEIGPAKLSRNNKPCCKCKITDDTNEAHNVTLYGDMPPTKLLGTQCLFSLSAFDGEFTDDKTGQQKQYTGYSGFWDMIQQPQQAPQSSPQAPQSPPQRPNVAQGGDISDARILALAERILKCMESLCFPNTTSQRPTQPSGPNPDYVGDDPSSADDEDIPF